MFQYEYQKPIIILSAPRAGSTLLFEALANSSELMTIGNESHGVFESNPKFNPLTSKCDSNQLTAGDASDEVVDEIRRRFFTKLCQRYAGFPKSQQGKRLLEKTPKNALRIPFLNKIFPDALFIYLYRNPRENISSIMDGWESGKFITYGQLSGREGKNRWSYLLPKGWQNHHQSSVSELACFQWQAANEAIMEGLSKIDSQRWMAISYQQLTQHTVQTLNAVSEFCQLSQPTELADITNGELKISRFTLTRPEKNKWHKNAAQLQPLLPKLKGTMLELKEFTPTLDSDDLDVSVNQVLLDKHQTEG